jgi:hypothetical protein
MKETSLPEVDISSKVMQRIHASHAAPQLHSRPRRRMRSVWIAACALLVISAASMVSASTLFSKDWYGIQFGITKGSNTSTPANKDEGPDWEMLQQALLETDRWTTISEEEAAARSPYSLLRPQKSSFKLVQSFGVELKNHNNRPKNDEWWINGFYDIFQWKKSDIVVRQYLNTLMTKALNDPEKTMAMYFVGEDWENVKISEDTTAMFRGSGRENYMSVNYRTADNKVVELQITGDISKKEMVRLVKTYTAQ